MKLLLAILLVFGFCESAFAEEKILSFRSYIRVNTDASLDVVEQIKVQSEGSQIRHGIYRDFPTRYKDKNGNMRRAEFKITNISRDGQNEEYHTENISGGQRVYLGSSNYTLQPNVYNYQISYHTSGWLRFFDNYDELYWNATGNGWNFPIDHASAIITLPQNTRPTQTAAYTGAEGSKSGNYNNFVDTNGVITFETSYPLSVHEGLTVAVGWPKGVITNTSEYKPSFLDQNRGVVLASLFFLIAAYYYYYNWNKVGRDPNKGTIIPLFTPPDNLSPAQCSYIYNMSSNTNKNLSAAIVNMAVKGFIKIKEYGKKKYILEKLRDDYKNLPKEEMDIAIKLFRLTDKAVIGEQDVESIQEASAAMDESLEANYKDNNFANNYGYTFVGVLLSLLVLVGIYFQISDSDGIHGLSINGKDDQTTDVFWFVSIWSLPACITLYAFIGSIKMLIKGETNSITTAIFASLFAVMFFGSEVYFLYKIGQSVGFLTPALILASFLLNIYMSSLLKAPTVAGRALMDKIEGFKMYLDVTEQDRLDKLNPPDVTQEVFEKYLPYAIALGLEQQWGERFAAQVALSSAYASTYHPLWYSGDMSNMNFSNFGSSLASSISNSVASSDSSGSSGGGSSGGGGGGGGGGGW